MPPSPADPADEGTLIPAAAAEPTRSSPAGPSWSGGLPCQLPARLGRYELRKLLGKGGMGAVYLAQDTQLDRPVALKVPLFSAGDGELRERFFREAKAAATLHHPNLCSVYDVGEVGGVLFLSMAFLEGQSLADLLRAGPLPPRQAALLVRQLAVALAEAHAKGIIHRDLKPANVMITPRKQPVIMDFGLARRTTGEKEARLTQSGAILGTPAYMPPEQVNGDTAAMGPGCDVYSLGVILYECLTGRVPFQGPFATLMAMVLLDPPPPPRQVRPDVPAALEAICLKALAKKPADRIPSMKAFAAALDQWLQGKVTEPGSATVPWPAPPPLPPALATVRQEAVAPKPRRQGRRSAPAWIWGLGGAGVVSLAAVAALALSGGKPADEARTPVPPPSTTAAPVTRPTVPQAAPTAPATKPPASQPQATQPAGPADDARVGELKRWKGHRGPVSGLAFCPDGRRAVSCSYDGSIILWDLATGKVIRRYAANLPPRWSVALAPTGQRVWSGGQEGPIRSWDLETGADLPALEGPAQGCPRLTNPPRSALIVGACEDGTLRGWTRQRGKEQHRLEGMQGAWGNVTHSPDGGHLLAAAADQSLALIELPAWKEVRRFVGHADLISKAVFTPDGKYAVSSSFDRTVRVWEVATGREVWRFGGSAGPVHGVGLLGDGRRVVAAGADKVLRVWDLATGQLLQEFPNHDDKIGVIVVAEDGRQVLVGTDAGTLVRYRLPVAPTAAVAEKAPDLGGVPAVIADKAGHVPPGLDWPDKGSGLYAYKDGRLLVRETGGGCWGLTQHRASHFAAELVGRVTGAPKQFWGLAFARVDDPGGAKERRRGVQVGLDRQNRLWISPLSFSTEPGREPLVGPLTPPALKPLTEFNTLRVEVRGRMVTVWVNGVLAGPPVLLDEELAPAYVYLRAEGGDKTSVLELDRLSAWSVADRPLPPLPATLEPTSPAEPAPSAAVREGRVALPALAPKQRLYHETFATARGWPHFKNGDGETSFTDGAGVVKHLKSWDLGWRCPFAEQANLIVQVEGRAQGPPDARWGLALASYKAGRGIRLLFDGEGRYLLEPDPAEGEKYLGPFVGIHPSPPGKAAEGWHQATLMVRDRKVQTFIDGRAVTDPLPLGRDLGAVQIFLVSHGGAGTRSEFRRLSVWSAENVAWPAAK